MKLLLVSEGKNELNVGEKRGALRILVERLLESATCVIETRKVSDPIIIREVGKGDGMLKRAVAWMRFAMKHKFDALVLVIDEDGFRDRIGQIKDAQQSLIFPIPRALGLAIRSFDAWMLADEVALTKVLDSPVSRQRDMETMRDPKGVCSKLCDERLSLSEFYARVANEARLADIESRCPRGFAPFAERIRQMKF